MEESGQTKIKLLPKPQKLVFSPEAQPRKQERLRDRPSFQQLQRQEMEFCSEWKGWQSENQEPLSKQGQEQKKKEPPSWGLWGDRMELTEEIASAQL